MELNYNLFALFETVGAVQALTLGMLLIVLNKRQYKSTWFLGLFLIFFALGTVPHVLESLNAYTVYPELYLLPLDFFWFYFPLFYLYTQYACIFSNQKKKFWVLYPGMVAFGFQLYLFFLPHETKLSVVQTMGYDIYTFIKLVYGLSVGIYTLKLLNRHKVEVYNSFSFVKSKELAWGRIYLSYALLGFLLYTLLFHTIPESFLARLFFVSFDLILIYWISYHGVKQQNVRSLFALKERYDFENEKPSEKNEIPLPPEKSLEELMGRIHSYLTKSESYTHPELTIVDLAEKLKNHPKRISAAINNVQHQNFNSYINQLRVKKAETLLKNEETGNLSIEGIGNEVGFHSKSAFYSAFKKETGTTPLKYKVYVDA